MDTNTIGRLYQAARNTVKRADLDPEAPRGAPGGRRIENFLTETLSLLVSIDSRPLMAALKDAGLVAESVGHETVDAQTQQRVGWHDTRGTVDLVLSFEAAGVPTREIWVEIKAGAGFHGDQICHYLSAIADAADGLPRYLVVLDLVGARQEPGAISLSWQQLHDAISSQDLRPWRDFAAFLEERRLVPAASLGEGPDRMAVSRVASILTTVLREAGQWQSLVGWAWGSGEQRVRALGEPSRARPVLGRSVVLWAPGQYIRLELGLHDRTAPVLGVRLATSRWYPVTQSTLRKLAREATSLDSAIWDRPDRRDDNVIAAAYRPLDAADDVFMAVSWITERIKELDANRLLVDLDGNGR